MSRVAFSARRGCWARHKTNHIQVVYAPLTEMGDKALAAKAAMLAELGKGQEYFEN